VERKSLPTESLLRPQAVPARVRTGPRRYRRPDLVLERPYHPRPGAAGVQCVPVDISLLVLGPDGWMQTANFIVFGLSIILFERGLQEAVVPRRPWGPMSILAIASGLALVAMAIFPTDPPGEWTIHGAVHLGVVAVLASLLPVACFVTAGEVKRHPSWCGHAGFTVLTGVLTGTLAVMLLLAWSGAWRALHPWIGLFERAVFAVPSIWMGVMGIRLVKERRGMSKEISS
jgi:Protein of unknown function (DUF998)